LQGKRTGVLKSEPKQSSAQGRELPWASQSDHRHTSEISVLPSTATILLCSLGSLGEKQTNKQKPNTKNLKTYSENSF